MILPVQFSATPAAARITVGREECRISLRTASACLNSARTTDHACSGCAVSPARTRLIAEPGMPEAGVLQLAFGRAGPTV